jgi:flavin reductase (DIM6/NTAB) family NADH-FMN oxidoreductase RutF
VYGSGRRLALLPGLDGSAFLKRSLGPRALLYPAPVVVVGSYDPAGRPNAMVAAWAGVCCSRPPCVSVSIRPTRHTYAGIKQRQAFTLGIASSDQVRQVDYLGVASGALEDKFAAAGLTPVPADKVDAPYVAEFPIALECRLLHALDLGVHTLFVGEVLDFKAEEAVLGPEGLPAIEKLRPLLYAPGQTAYYGIGPRLASAFAEGRGVTRT